MQVINRPSDKYNGSADVRVVCLHHTAGSVHSDIATLWGKAEVSIHAYITKNGDIHLGVPFGKRAWHAGFSVWQGISDVNSISIGIELENYGNGTDPYPIEQLKALDYCLVALIRPLYGNLPITRHRDISLEGKVDPSDNFPWGDYSGGIKQVFDRSQVSGKDLQEDDDIMDLFQNKKGEVWACNASTKIRYHVSPKMLSYLTSKGLKVVALKQDDSLIEEFNVIK